MTRLFAHVVIVIALGAFLGCGGSAKPYNPTEPTPIPEPIPVPTPTPEPTPTPTPTPVPTPTPEPTPTPTPIPEPTPEPPRPTLVTLTGMVRSSNGSPLSGATVKILDGVNAGKSGTTVNGTYRFDGLTVGNGNLSATAVGYNEARAGVHINGTNTLDFALEPANYAGTWIGSGTGTASDGSPVSVTVELQIIGGVGSNVIDLWKVSYRFRDLPSPAPANWCYHNSPFTGRLQIPVRENEFSLTFGQRDTFAYTPTVFKGTFPSTNEVEGEVTLVRTSHASYNECPSSATVRWKGRR